MGKQGFDKDWIYLTLISQKSDQKIKIYPKFKSDYAGPRKTFEKQERPSRHGRICEDNTIENKDDGGGDSPKITSFEAARAMDVDNIENMLIEKGLTTKENIKKILTFVDKIQDDEQQQEKMYRKINQIKEERCQKIVKSQPMKSLNPDLMQIEKIFNPKEDELAANEGMFVHRNLNIANFYREYKEEKLKITSFVQKKNAYYANVKKEEIE